MNSLDLSKNKLKELPIAISNLRELSTLNLKDNLLMEVSSYLGDLSNLRWLNLSNNGIDLNPPKWTTQLYYQIFGGDRLRRRNLPKSVLALEQNGCEITI
ncbi:MAG: leucine-rich repeat domain-containing protein [Aureispira sp.]|nr:leucine-rich repeat domain-containing protein [Aureispira sp.]